MRHFTFVLLIIVPFLLNAQTEGVIKTIPSPEYPYGLTFDGNYLWVGTSYAGGDFIWKIDTTDGSVVDSIPIPEAYQFYRIKGLAWDGNNLWVFEYVSGTDKFFKVDPNSGAVLKTINSPVNNFIGGMAYHDGHIWFSQYSPDDILIKMDTLGVTVDTIVSVGEQPMGVAFDGQYIWCAEDTGYGATRQEIYKYDPVAGIYTGEFIPNPDDSPRDMTWDGNYLWLIGYNSRTIYQISLIGGTPQINIPITDINFSQTTVGDTGNFVLSVNNTGSVTLHIDSIVINNSVFFVEENQFPYEIAPGASSNFNFRFVPLGYNFYTGNVQIYSDDPVLPLIQIDMAGQGVLSGSVISLTSTSHDFGNVWIPEEGTAFWNLGIINMGDQNLQVSDFIFSNLAFNIDNSLLPFFVASNDTFFVSIFFTPTEDTTYADTVEISTNDPSNPVVTVNLQGSAMSGPFGNGFQFWSFQVPDNPSGSNYDKKVEGLKQMGDVNGDGINEVIISTENNLTICLNGASSGIADSLWIFNTGIDNNNTGSISLNGMFSAQKAIQIASDLNNDGITDVVIGTDGGNEHVYALSGVNGDVIWSFGNDTISDLGGFGAIDVKRDFNGDSIPDVLAVASSNSQGVGNKSVFCFNGENGNIIWQYPITIPGSASGYSVISIDDITGDNEPDAIAGYGGDGSTRFARGLNGSTGSFLWNFPLSSGAKELLEISIPDSAPDVIVANFDNFVGTVYRIDGETGTQKWSYAAGGTIIQMELLPDINENGYDEILLANFSSASHVICLEGETGAPLWYMPTNDYRSYAVKAIPDLNGDGVYEMIAGDQSGDLSLFSGAADSMLFSQNLGDRIYTVEGLNSIDGNNSFEILAGLDDGRVFCFSGGVGVITAYPKIRDENIVNQFKLFQNFPNPFNPSTEIRFRLPESGIVNLTVYNLLGQEIAKLINNKFYSTGEYVVEFNATNLSSGVYFYKMEIQFGVQLNKMIFLK